MAVFSPQLLCKKRQGGGGVKEALPLPPVKTIAGSGSNKLASQFLPCEIYQRSSNCGGRFSFLATMKQRGVRTVKQQNTLL